MVALGLGAITHPFPASPVRYPDSANALLGGKRRTGEIDEHRGTIERL